MFVSLTVSLSRSNLIRIAFSYWASTSVFPFAMNFCMHLFDSSSMVVNSFRVRMPSAPGGVPGDSVQGRFPTGKVRAGDAVGCMIASLADDCSFVADDACGGMLQQRTKKVQGRSRVLLVDGARGGYNAYNARKLGSGRQFTQGQALSQNVNQYIYVYIHIYRYIHGYIYTYQSQTVKNTN